MKKIWKNLCACSLALACTGGLTACGEEEKPVSTDLDNDGVISTWESLYEDAEHNIDKTILGEITYISNADELLDINNHVDEKKIYALKSDIDLGGREVSINLGKSEFYGFNYVITNFNMKTITGGDIAESGYENTYIKTLFRNGTGVFATRIFMGYQTIKIDNAERNSTYYASPFFNVPVVSDIEVKGKLKVDGKGVDNRISSSVNVSLLYTGMATEVVDEEENTKLIEDVTSIDNATIDGEIVIANEPGSRIGINAGSIASTLTRHSVAYNCYAQVKIMTSSSEAMSNIAGIVGLNQGFVTTCTYTGEVVFENNKSLSVLYDGGINIGGIVGTNDKLAEIKNCSTNAKVTMATTEVEESVDGSEYYVGGVAGQNNGGVVEMCQSDAVITINNLYKVTTGAMVGTNLKGVLVYNICRGSITATNVAKLITAQAIGLSDGGLIEKLVTTTPINIDNTGRTTEELKIGMVTCFKEIDNSPYFRRIMVDGTNNVTTREIDNSKVDYKQGLRFPYQVQVGMDEDEYVYDTVLPEIFENVYKSEGFRLNKYSVTGETKTQDTVTITYANNAVGTSTGTTRWMIDYMDFKNFLNHNEVSLDTTLNLSNLHFTISDEGRRLTSYFGQSKYNGEFAYFDREFTKSYNHQTSATGSCEHDPNDEMLSFVYDMISSNNGKSEELYVIKVADTYIDRALDNTEVVGGLSADTNIFVDKVCNVFGCLSTSVSVTRYAANGDNLEDDVSGTEMAKFVEITFSDSKSNYSMKMDISNMQNTSSVNPEKEFLVYVIFTISSRIV